MLMSEEDYLAHYGIQRKSGRYPWGSGANPHQRSMTFLQMVEDLEKNHGMTKPQIAKSFSTPEHPFTTTDLVRLKSIASNIKKQEQVRTALKLQDKGMHTSAIARQMELNESTVRSLLVPGRLEKLNIHRSVADMLKRQVEEKGLVDVGVHVEKDLPIGQDPAVPVGISKDKFRTALAILKEEGYPVHEVKQRQVGTGENTTRLVLCKPGTTKEQAFANRHNIQLIAEKSNDGGRTFDGGLKPPLNISSKRVAIKYKEDGGADADGVIFVRPGVKDVSLGKARYAQVRIAIDNSHYLKGMAVYKDDLPPGVDLMFHTNKSNTGNKLDAMKPFKADPDGFVDPVNPFGAAIKIGGQIKDAKNNVTSAMNLINEEGDWDTWSRTLSSQVLSKQKPPLIKTQLDLTHERRRVELEEIKALTNPQVRKKLLQTFGDETDAAAVDLKAVAMPRQANKVILPSTKVKPTEVFAPTFADGTRVVLIRYPHAGTFEIPELTVNNRTREARKLVGLDKGGTALDAIVIHPKVAEHLSGADFDGDAVVIIRNDRKEITTTHPLDQLKDFDPRSYQVPLLPGDKPTITDSQKQIEMGKITNLISDMTIKGAGSHDIGLAVRHSMVVIDSEKHNLDFRASERDHQIVNLKRKYQGVNPKSGQPRGASTLITRASADYYVPRYKERPADQGGPIDRRTGEKKFVPTGEHTVKFRDANGRKQTKPFRSREAAEQFVRDQQPNGKISLRLVKSQRLAETHDAFELVSARPPTPEEKLYAEHSNRLKALANEARKEMVNTKLIRYSPSAKKVYATEVATLNANLAIAERNAPLERQAQAVADMMVRQRKRANPGMDRDTEKKLRGQALNEARIRTGAGKERIPITPREWEAIQAGAISNDKLERILRNTDIKRIRELATPQKNTVMTSTATRRAKQMLANGFTLAEISAQLGIAPSTLQSGLSEEVSN